jgi:hypothetical protein
MLPYHFEHLSIEAQDKLLLDLNDKIDVPDAINFTLQLELIKLRITSYLDTESEKLLKEMKKAKKTKKN